MEKRVKGTPHGPMGWRVDRVEYINTTVYELCDKESGYFRCNTIEEREGYADLFRTNEATSRMAGAVKTADDLVHVVAALDEAAAGERTRRGLAVMRQAQERNAEHAKEWEARRG